MVNLRDLTQEELESFLGSLGYPAYRGRQVYRWIFAKRASKFEDMTNLPKELRMTLARVPAIETLRVARVSKRGPDGTR
ncbi:MAG: 23S rRNA (adenine(2503)-C(2))-methyltransferase RlmN, partial [Calditrichaeota bacterium]|nr:23S rRNA (adenine(2503)-C(2))-methyltransferase RlmN [Calditrichota bacterium]